MSETITQEQRAKESEARLNVPAERRPRHIAIIMDGNGRWAQARDEDRTVGHQAGGKAAHRVIEEAVRLQLDVLTLYSFSIENWKRPANEVDALMRLLVQYLTNERELLLKHDIRFVQLGRRDGLSKTVLAALDETIEATRDAKGLTLCVALNYGGRTEITDAVRRIAEKVENDELDAAEITEQTVADHLYTAGIPDPDLLIRTAGQMRISNYLLWQISYAELHVTNVYWPDFAEDDLHDAIRDYASRDRRFGDVSKST